MAKIIIKKKIIERGQKMMLENLIHLEIDLAIKRKDDDYIKRYLKYYQDNLGKLDPTEKLYNEIKEKVDNYFKLKEINSQLHSNKNTSN